MNPWVVASFFAGCLVWIPVAVGLVSLINWMVMGELDLLTGIVCCFLAILLGVLTVRPPYPPLSPLFCLVAWGAVFAFAPLRSAVRAAQFAAIDREQASRAYELLERQPNNTVAASRLARVLHSRGFPVQAIAILENLGPALDPAIFPEETHLLRRWKSAPLPLDAHRDLPCTRCRARVRPGPVVCQRCGHRYLLDYIASPVATSGPLIAAWVTVASLTAIIPLAARYLALGWALAVIGIALAVGTGVVIRAFTQGRHA